MTYRLLALDIDGTLLDSSRQLTPAVARAVGRAQSAGWLVCLVSGRRPRKMLPLARTLKIDTPLVALNGGAVCHPHTLEPFYVRTLSVPLADAILQVWEEEGIPAFAYRNTLKGPDTYYSLPNPWPPASQYIAAEGPNLEQLSSLVTARRWAPVRLIVMHEQDIACRARALAQPYTGPSTSTFLGYHYNSWSFEVYPRTSKAHGVHFLCQHYGLRPEQVVAVGDNVNDVDMLSCAGLGVAMGNATAEVQRVADVVIGHHDEAGLADFIDQLLTERGGA